MTCKARWSHMRDWHCRISVLQLDLKPYGLEWQRRPVDERCLRACRTGAARSDGPSRTASPHNSSRWSRETPMMTDDANAALHCPLLGFAGNCPPWRTHRFRKLATYSNKATPSFYCAGKTRRVVHHCLVLLHPVRNIVAVAHAVTASSINVVRVLLI